jgi:hypothetical protein
MCRIGLSPPSGAVRRGSPVRTSSRPTTGTSSRSGSSPGSASATALRVVAAGGDFYVPDCYHHQQYLDKNPAEHRGLGGTGVKLSDPIETNRGSCPKGLAPAPDAP